MYTKVYEQQRMAMVKMFVFNLIIDNFRTVYNGAVKKYEHFYI